MDTGTATHRLHAMVMSGARISWRVQHAVIQANERKVPRHEAERIIRRGSVVKVEFDGADMKWLIPGEDIDGRPVHVVVVPQVDDVLRVITVIRKDE